MKKKSKQSNSFQRAADAPNLPATPFRFICYFVNQFRWWYVAMVILEVIHATCGIMLPYAIGEIIRGVTRSPGESKQIFDAVSQPLMLFTALSVGEVVFGRSAGLLQTILHPIHRQHIVRSLYAYLQHHSHRYLSSSFSGALAHRISETSLGVTQTMQMLITEFMPVIIVYTVTTILLYRVYPPLAGFVGLWAVLFITISFWLATRCRIYSRKAAAARSETTGIIVDAVTNLNSSRLFARLGFERRYLNEQLRDELKEVRKSNWYSERIRWFQFISAAVLKIGTLYYSLSLWSQGTIATADFVVATSLSLLIISEARNLSKRFLEFFEHIGNIANGVFTKVLSERYRVGKNLANSRWIERVIEKTWLSLPSVESWGYRFPKEDGESVRQSYYGPEYMRVLRKNLLRVGVQILDQSPALELLLADDGSVAGARGVQRQHHRTYTVRAGAVVLANGGCAFLSKALGCNTNTGDGLLMAVEAGGELSSMEASNHYAISTAFNATVTRGVPFGWASYTDEAGNDLGGYINGRRDPSFLPNALLKGSVYACLDRATPEVKAVVEKSHFIAFLPYTKAGIDPYTERVPVTLVLEGTVRGTGGIRIVNDDCATKVPGLYAAGDAASREFLAGLASGGGGPNAAWAISTGQWAGVGAADFAKSLGAHANERVARPAGQVGLGSSPSHTSETFDSEAIVRGVQAEMFPLEKNYLRSEQGLLDSLAKLEKLWEQVQGNPKQDSVRDVEFSRRAAALTAVARWAYFSALHRTETRSEHIRIDYPETDPNQRYYQATGGLDKLWVRRDWITDAMSGDKPQSVYATPPVITTQTTPSVSKL